MEPHLLRIPEAATALALSRSRVYELVASGDIPVVRIGRSVRVPATALAAYVTRLQEAAL